MSHAERLATTATVFLARVVKLESFVQAFANEVKLGAIDVRKAFRIDQHLDAVVFEDRVFGGQFVGVLELVGQAGTPGGLYAQPHSHALAAFGDVARHVAGSRFGQGD